MFQTIEQNENLEFEKLLKNKEENELIENKNNNVINHKTDYNNIQGVNSEISQDSKEQEDRIKTEFQKNNLSDEIPQNFMDSKQEIQNNDLMQNNLNKDEEEVEILDLIPVLDIDEPDSSDIFKRKMIQLILEYQIDNDEATEALFEATVDKNPNIDQESLKEMFVEILEFIEIYNNGDLDFISDEED